MNFCVSQVINKQSDEKENEDWLAFGKILPYNNTHSIDYCKGDNNNEQLVEPPLKSITPDANTEQLVPTNNEAEGENSLPTSQDDLFLQQQKPPVPATLTVSVTNTSTMTCANTAIACASTYNTCANTSDTCADTCAMNKLIEDEDIHCVPNIIMEKPLEVNECDQKLPHNTAINSDTNYQRNNSQTILTSNGPYCCSMKERPVGGVSYRIEEDKEELLQLEDEDDIILSQEQLVHSIELVMEREYKTENRNDDEIVNEDRGIKGNSQMEDKQENTKSEDKERNSNSEKSTIGNKEENYTHDNNHQEKEEELKIINHQCGDTQNKEKDQNPKYDNTNEEDMCVPEIIEYVVNNDGDYIDDNQANINEDKHEEICHTDNKSITLDCLSSFTLSDAPPSYYSLFSFQQPLPPLSKSQLIHTLDKGHHQSFIDGTLLLPLDTPPQWRQPSSPPYKRLKWSTALIEEEEEEVNDGCDTVLQALPVEQAKEYSPHLDVIMDGNDHNDNDGNNDDNNSHSIPVPTNPPSSQDNRFDSYSSSGDKISVGTMTTETILIKQQSKVDSHLPTVLPYKSVLKRGKLYIHVHTHFKQIMS